MYDLDYRNVRSGYLFGIMFILIGLILFIIFSCFKIGSEPIIPVFLLYVIIVTNIVLGSYRVIKVFKKIRKMKYLEVNGSLVKNLPYTMVFTNFKFNNKDIMAIAVDYILPTGEVLHLVGDPRYDRKYSDLDGSVDLLIDLNDIDNYYIDFNIRKKI